jgi:hypothetical protein
LHGFWFSFYGIIEGRRWCGCSTLDIKDVKGLIRPPEADSLKEAKMRQGLKLLLLTGVLLCSFCLYGFCQYYSELDGKWVVIKGPYYWPTLGLCRDELACDGLMYVLRQGSKRDFESALNSFKVLRIKNDTPAVITYMDVAGSKAKVTILEGLHKGYSGWIPLWWLQGNSHRPRIPEHKDPI